MLAIAEMRTDIVDGLGKDGGDCGPFALNSVEWQAFCTLKELGIAFSELDRTDWLAQCMVFAVMANVLQRNIATKLSDEPTALELCLCQIVGSTAAHLIIASPKQAIGDVMSSVTDEELAAEGITRNRLRDTKYLSLESGELLLKELEADLKKSLDDTRQFAAQVNVQLLASEQARVDAEGLPSLDIDFDSAVIPPKRKGNAQLIAKRFAQAGYGSIQQIAAIANAIAESSLNETASGDSGHSHGLFQLNQNGGVGAGFSTKELNDPERNISIMLEHIAAHETAADRAFRATTSILAAVTIFVRNFERPRDQANEIAKRVAIAQKIVV